MPTLFILCGPAGSGKSTWLANVFMQNWDKSMSVIVSRDAIRFAELTAAGLDKKDYFKKENIVYAKYTAVIAKELAAGNDVYADSTCLTKKSREKLIRTVERQTRTPFNVIALDFYREDMKIRCYNQNRQRSGLALVPDAVVEQQCDNYERPTTAEYKICQVFPIDIDERMVMDDG